MASRTPPKFVPTLTEVVHSGPAPLSPTPSVSQEQLAQRVMQRVDLVLDRRLREAVATVVLEQTDLLTPMLRERLEAVVREVVAAAVADEMNARGGPPR
jgi:hypothetical protein